jgi:hypothetical protein
MREEATGKIGTPSEERQKPERPRDRLGRPLPWGATSELHLPDLDAMTLDETHEAGRRFAEEGNWFGAHEAWETAWKKARATGDEEFYKGLSQMGAGYVHLLRGNAHGATTLLRRAAGRIGEYPDPHRGISTAALAVALGSLARRVADGEVLPGDDAVFEAPPLTAGR